MAEITEQTFQQLLDEQRRTTQALGKVSLLQKNNVEVIKDDVKQGELFGPPTLEQSKNVSNQLEKNEDKNTTLLQQILESVTLISNKFGLSESEKESLRKKEEFKDSKFLEGLDGFKTGTENVFKSMGKFFKDNKGLASILGLSSLIFFLKSDTFFKFLGYLDEKLIPSIVKFFKGIDKIGAFIDEKLGIEGGTTGFLAKLGLAAVALIAFTRPLKTLKLLLLDLPFAILSRGFKIFTKINFGKLGRGVSKLFGIFGKKNRTKLARGFGNFTKSVSGLGSKIGTGAKGLGKTVAGVGSRLGSLGGVAGRVGLAGLGRAASFATGPVGLVIGAGITGIIGGVKAGMKKAEDETATKMDIAKAALVGGAVGILTLGMGSPEGVSKFFSGIGDKIGEKFDAFKEMLPTKDELKEKMAGFAEGLKGKLSELGDKFTSLKDDMISRFEDITGIELPSFEDVSEKIKNFGADLKKRVIDAIPTKEKVKEFGGKLLQFGKDLIKKDATKEQIDTAVAAALQKHFEQFHAMGENALNKMEGGQTTVVNQTTVDASNNSKMESVQHNIKQISHTDPTQLAVANAQ
mgnify:FL=1